MSKWRPGISSGAGDAAAEKDRQLIAYYEKKLGIKSGVVPEEFQEDGLDLLMDLPVYQGDDEEHRSESKGNKKRKQKKKKRKVQPDASLIEPQTHKVPVAVPKKKVNTQKQTKKKAPRPQEKKHQPETTSESGNNGAANEIDELFSAGLKKAKRTKKDQKQPKKSRPADDGDDDFNSRSFGSKRTEEGYRIYTEAELKIGQGGGTPLCPFDCQCCFG